MPPTPEKLRQFITDDSAAKAMVEYADRMGQDLKNSDVKSHQIRNAFGSMKKLEMEGWQENVTLRHLHLLKPRLAYAAARQETKQKDAMKRLEKDLGEAINAVSSGAEFERFCQFFEAILAYHKAHGGK